LSERLANYPELHVALIGGLLILIIRVAPDGVWGASRRLVRRLRRGAATPQPVSPPAIGSFTAPTTRASAGTTLLRAIGVGKAYGGVHAVDGVDAELRAGEVLGMVGPNGAGKSTLIGLLSGALTGDGRVELLGEDVTALGAAARARRGIGRTHQVPRPFAGLTVMENLMVAQMHGAAQGRRAARAECRRILHRCDLLEFADVRASELGLLRLKRLELARALAVRPRILLLDEIGAGLVESEVRELIELIRSLRDEVDAILIVEHVLDVIRECCDRLIVLDRGRVLVEGKPEEVLRDQQVATIYLGTAGGEEVRPARTSTRRTGHPILEVKGIAAQYGARCVLRSGRR
jgi:ABC-type branched-subunit amino acid transport system ATPase component